MASSLRDQSTPPVRAIVLILLVNAADGATVAVDAARPGCFGEYADDSAP